MNRIVRENYPVANPPEDLQRAVHGAEKVTLTIEVSVRPTTGTQQEAPSGQSGHLSRFRHLARSNFNSTEEVVEHVRALRDEWDERDRALDRIRSGS